MPTYLLEKFTVNFEYFYPKWHRWLENCIYASESGVSILIRDITECKRSQQLLTAQYAIAYVLSETTTLVNGVLAILQSLCESLGWQAGIFWSVDDEANVVHPMSTWYSPDLEKKPFNQHTITFSEGLPDRIWASGQPVWISEPAQDENFFATAIRFPIRLGNKILAALEFFSAQILEPDTNLLQMMSAIATQIGQFIEQQRSSSLLQESEKKYVRFLKFQVSRLERKILPLLNRWVGKFIVEIEQEGKEF
ncbi:MAG: GAF domain-containing protein [Nostoc sp. DedQUE04]|uniref:GAF domain-containing protein n=1 Tax=Nostoc sp. DedQUE04 TaxID=3075390 RepID=UPI002AD49CC7|nr:GAF domain-containing protein [Nostoc sp. DedQUE04]MDZ8134494.1 GAF domain-containing protein [Nostoc sp. DedQUE04]